MTLVDLQIFYAVAEGQGFTAAANALDMPIASVSRRIIHLENELGFILFKRTTRSVVLTKEGTVYYQKSKLLYEQHLRLNEELLDSKRNINGKVRVQLLPESRAVMPYLQKFQTMHPEIELDLIISSENLNLLEQGIDIAVKVGELQDSSLICRKLDTVERCILASPDFLSRNGPFLSDNDLLTTNCMRFRTSTGKIESEWPINNSQKVLVTGNLISNDIGLLHEACLLGQGIALLPKLLCESDLATGKLKHVCAIENHYKDDLWLLYPDKKYQSEASRALVNFITSIKE